MGQGQRVAVPVHRSVNTLGWIIDGYNAARVYHSRLGSLTLAVLNLFG